MEDCRVTFTTELLLFILSVDSVGSAEYVGGIVVFNVKTVVGVAVASTG